MKSIIAILSLVAVAKAGTLLPVDQSTVNVKSERNGQDYSYTIQENRGGVAIEPIVHTIHHTIPTLPIVKTVPEIHHAEPIIHHEKEQPLLVHQEQKRNEFKPQGRELTYNAVPLLTYPSYPSFYNYIPGNYRYAYSYPYAYPYAYHLNYNLIPLKAD